MKIQKEVIKFYVVDRKGAESMTSTAAIYTIRMADRKKIGFPSYKETQFWHMFTRIHTFCINIGVADVGNSYFRYQCSSWWMSLLWIPFSFWYWNSGCEWENRCSNIANSPSCIFNMLLSVNGCSQSLLLALTKFSALNPDFVENVNKIEWELFIEDK